MKATAVVSGLRLSPWSRQSVSRCTVYPNSRDGHTLAHPRGRVRGERVVAPMRGNPRRTANMVSRETIDSGAYLAHFKSMPDLWTPEQIAASLEETLRRKPHSAGEVWIFAYGSLIWNPMFEFKARTVATLHNWRRSFCLQMTAGRGSSITPGRMLALQPGGSTTGLALQLRDEQLRQDLGRIWTREMVLGSYRPMWAPITLSDGLTTFAIVFVADDSREQFQVDSSVETVAPLIGNAVGEFGTNADYLHRLHVALADWNLRDPYVDALVEEVSRHAARKPGSSLDVCASPNSQ